MKQYLLNHLKNIGGWTTKRKLILFSVDDYGNLRIRNRKALYTLRKEGLELSKRFDSLDNLENTNDLSMLLKCYNLCAITTGGQLYLPPTLYLVT